MDSVLPAEIILNIFNHLSLKDLVRIERSCKRLQSCALSEIEKRIRKGSSKDEWGILVGDEVKKENQTHKRIGSFRTSECTTRTI